MTLGNRIHSFARGLIERRLGGYRQAFHHDDPSLPERVSDRARAPRVAVIGGGLAGLSAAATLAERGLRVSLIERNAYLGGKIGSWTQRFDDGSTARVDHGFHAFFANYYNLRALLDRAGVARASFAPIDDYTIVRRDGRAVGFRGVDTTPLLNLLSLSRVGLFRRRDLVLDPSLRKLDPFLRYDRDATFAAFDDVPFQRFADEAGLPAELRLVFDSFARAFFAEPSRISLAELIKSFHFYYLSNDGGLLYEHLVDDHGHALIDPIAAHLASLGVTIERGRDVRAITRDGAELVVAGERFEHVVLACDVVGTRAIAAGSAELLAGHPAFGASLAALRASGRYANLRVWLDRDGGRALPVFAITDGELLDAIAAVHRIAPEARAWAAAQDTPGSVFELHAYSVKASVGDDAIASGLRAELDRFVPELRGARTLREHLQVGRDFTSFDVGQFATRPEVETPVPGLYLAGDWVKLPRPAMLMEAAAMSGALAANAILRRERLREQPVWSVPPRGVLAV